jgi:hypothetical protein
MSPSVAVCSRPTADHPHACRLYQVDGYAPQRVADILNGHSGEYWPRSGQVAANRLTWRSRSVTLLSVTMRRSGSRRTHAQQG